MFPESERLRKQKVDIANMMSNDTSPLHHGSPALQEREREDDACGIAVGSVKSGVHEGCRIASTAIGIMDIDSYTEDNA